MRLSGTETGGFGPSGPGTAPESAPIRLTERKTGLSKASAANPDTGKTPTFSIKLVGVV